MKLLITFLAIGSVVGALESTSLRGRELSDTKEICIYLGPAFRSQTFEVPSEKFRFFTSSARTYPATDGACDPADVFLLTSSELEERSFCRLFKHNLDEWWTVRVMDAATDWMLNNGFTTGACKNKNTFGTMNLKNVKATSSDDWDNLYFDLVDLLSNFSYAELLDAEDCLYNILDQSDTPPQRVFNRGETRTCRDGSFCTFDSDCNGGSCQNRNDRRK